MPLPSAICYVSIDSVPGEGDLLTGEVLREPYRHCALERGAPAPLCN